ncbi:MAG: 2-phosphosulfolactate phosphatase [Gemmatimonadetes bacterium]|nr:2-phosphosulfolactate phosphatase [Gemmatimonadota bacterium]
MTRTRSVRVLVTPAGMGEMDLSRDLVIVIDVLRACTTIAHALEAGARGVIPVETVEDATHRAVTLGRDDVILGGERESVRVEGFDLGNSPLEYTPDALAGRAVVLSTTNGSRALERASGALGCVAAAFVTRAAVARRAASFERVLIVCAGHGGFFSFEDFLCAGLLVDGIRRRCPEVDLRDGARAALELGQGQRQDLLPLIRGTDHGRVLEGLGRAEDLAAAAALDRLDFVPTLRDGLLIAEDPEAAPPPAR